MSEDKKIGLMMLAILMLFVGMYFYIKTLPSTTYDNSFREQLLIESEHESIANAYKIEAETESYDIIKFDAEQPTATIEKLNSDEITVYTLDSIKKISISEFNQMCRVVMNEAGGESYKCQVAVAETIINRVNSDKFPNTITEVLWQPYQYSHNDNGKITDSVMEAVTQALETRIFDKDMVYVRENYYFGFPEAEDYFNVDEIYFSTIKDCDMNGTT